MVIFTSICANYLHKARTLAQSVKEHIPDAIMVVCLVEREVNPEILSPYFDNIVLAKDAWEGNFDRFIFKHTIVEASTAVKGQFFRYLLKQYPSEDKFIYLDPDVYVYSDFVELRDALDSHPIILCPHLLQPGNIDMELSSTAHGVYNLGFLAIRRSEEGCRCVNWWAERLYLFCYDDIQRGIFTDQKWMDLAPCFFDVLILKHRGYDFAPWSLLNCGLSRDGDQYYVQGDPLRFIHFSGFGPTAEKCMREWLPEGEEEFHQLYREYGILHDANNRDGIVSTPWSYASYHSGEPVRNDIRAAYRGNYDVMFLKEDPFAMSNSFYEEKLLPEQINGLRRVMQLIKKGYKTWKEHGFYGMLMKIKNKMFN